MTFLLVSLNLEVKGKTKMKRNETLKLAAVNKTNYHE